MQETWVQSLGWENPLEKVEKAMAPHSSTLAWKIAWAEEPGRLQSMGSLRVRHNRATSLSLFTFMYWRRKQLSTAVFSSGKSHGQRSLAGYSLWGPKELDMTEWLIHIHTHSHTCSHVHTYSVSDSCRIFSVVPYVVQYISVGYFISTSVYMLIPTS